jgi:hypothetical protein
LSPPSSGLQEQGNQREAGSKQIRFPRESKFTFNGLDDAMSQKKVMFITTAVRSQVLQCKLIASLQFISLYLLAIMFNCGVCLCVCLFIYNLQLSTRFFSDNLFSEGLANSLLCHYICTISLKISCMMSYKCPP